ncbi:MAG TPA: hypothetical protein VLS89_00510 [Candidatus Nanopelagicales bacterium]|nr:hypothetical protein [Candidatus Nanopelagicales bacterium]
MLAVARGPEAQSGRRKADDARLAAMLSAYDDLIENNTSRIKILEDIKRAAYESLIGRWISGPQTDSRAIETIPSKLPEGRQVCQLGELIQEVCDAVNPSHY